MEMLKHSQFLKIIYCFFFRFLLLSVWPTGPSLNYSALSAFCLVYYTLLSASFNSGVIQAYMFELDMIFQEILIVQGHSDDSEWFV